MRLPSSSEIGRVVACPASAWLPAVEDVTENPYSAKGDTVHGFVRAVLGGATRAEALAEVPEDDPGLELCRRIDVDHLPRGGHLEVALAWDPASGLGRILGYDLGRDYAGASADRGREFVGTADYAGLRADGKVVVIDWKTGWHAGRAADSWQLRSLLVMFCAAVGATEGLVAHAYLRDEEPQWDAVEVDAMDVASYRAEMRSLAESMTGDPKDYRRAVEVLASSGALVVPVTRNAPDVTEGAHCRWCPAWRSCPAKTNTLRALAGDELAVGGVQAMTLGRVAEVVRTLERYEEAAKRAWRDVYALVEFGVFAEVPLGDGRVLKMAPGRAADQVVKPEAALSALEEVCDTAAAERALSTTKGKIEEQARLWAIENRRPIGETQGKVLARARELGAVEKLPGETKPRIVKG